MCTSNCPITVVSADDRVVSIEHPDCVRAESMLEQLESPQRITLPRARSSSDGLWQNVYWHEALLYTAGKLLEIRDRYGPESVVFAAGYTKEVRPYLKRLAHAFGSPHYVTESSCCFASGFVAATVTLGKEYEYFLAPGRRRYPQTKCRLVWTNNPSESQIPYGSHHFLVDAPRVRTIVVDPRRTPMTDVAEIHLQLRPGTDGALALGLAHLIFEEGLHDQTFLDEYAYGLDPYRSYIRQFTPAATSKITAIPEETIVAAAKLYGSSHPAQIAISPNATTHHSNGFQAHRAILSLAAICGNLDVDGGNRPWTERFSEVSIDLPSSSKQSLGAKEYPLFVEHYGEAQGMILADAIESGQVKAVFSIGMNLMMWPNSKRLEKALRRLELFTVCDFFPNPTVDAATVFFPAATHLERRALIFSGTGRVQYRPAVVPPRGESRGDTEIVFEIAKRLGLEDKFWNGDIHASYQERLDGSGLRFEELSKDGVPVDITVESPDERAYMSKGFGTPTGKVELVSTLLEKAGHKALPVYEEPKWSPISAPEVAKDFPLILTTGGRSKNYTHSQGRLLKTLRKREPDPRLQINPEDAKRRAIQDDDWIEVSSPLGAIEMKASVTGAVPEGVVHASHGWAGQNINEVIPDHLDPISGFPSFKSSLCQVRKK
jgi:anaerobic selenocysteine-containing dehydrogenase